MKHETKSYCHQRYIRHTSPAPGPQYHLVNSLCMDLAESVLRGFSMAMANASVISLGQRRLGLLHARVNYMLEKMDYDEDCYPPCQMMCPYCTDKFNWDQSEPLDNKKFVYHRCSGTDWICRARHECACPIYIQWNKEQLMTHNTYVKKINQAIQTMDPRIAMFSINCFNNEIAKEQHHMVKIVQVGEQFIYHTYSPFQLEDGMFPVPPIGHEWSAVEVLPWSAAQSASELITKAHWKNYKEEKKHDKMQTWIQVCNCANSDMVPEEFKCDKCGTNYNERTVICREEVIEEHVLDDCKMPGVPKQADWDKFYKVALQNECEDISHREGSNQTGLNEIRIKHVWSLNGKELLEQIHTITGHPDPCEWCKWRKINFPKLEIHCSGVYDLCHFKHRMLEEAPYGLNRYGSMHHAIMKCDSVQEYARLLDKIFSVSAVERAVTLKLIVDDDIAFYHPHMCTVINCYDALIMRWYWGDNVLNKPICDTPSSSSLSSDEEEEEKELMFLSL